MKIVLIILAVLLILFIILQSFISMSVQKSEGQKYTIVKTFPDFEVRFYPATTMATIRSEAKTYRDLSGPGFRKLANYIFGGNESGAQIAMTSPVHMDIQDSVSTMSFVMPSSWSTDSLPRPNDPRVAIQQSPEEYVAAIRFGGFASDEVLKLQTEKLAKLLKEAGITPLGHFRFLGYNPPFQLVGRRNEIIITVVL